MTEPWSCLEASQNPRLEEFWKFHSDNPNVFHLFADVALKTKRSGRDRYSIQAIAEVVRWQTDIETIDQHFKLPNNTRAYYARLLMHEFPSLKNFFNTRPVAGADLWWRN